MTGTKRFAGHYRSEVEKLGLSRKLCADFPRNKSLSKAFSRAKAEGDWFHGEEFLLQLVSMKKLCF